MIEQLLILDFEANCADMQLSNRDQLEIIEFPILVFDIKTNSIIDKFHTYVRPTNYPMLSEFCKRIARVDQTVINNAPILEYVLWLAEKFIAKYPNSAFITDGNWDLRVQLMNQLRRDNIELSERFTTRIKNQKNLKVEFVNKYGNTPMQKFVPSEPLVLKERNSKYFNIKEMLYRFEMKFIGNSQSGLDNTINISRIIQCMIIDGHTF